MHSAPAHRLPDVCSAAAAVAAAAVGSVTFVNIVRRSVMTTSIDVHTQMCHFGLVLLLIISLTASNFIIDSIDYYRSTPLQGRNQRQSCWNSRIELGLYSTAILPVASSTHVHVCLLQSYALSIRLCTDSDTYIIKNFIAGRPGIHFVLFLAGSVMPAERAVGLCCAPVLKF